MKPPQAEVLLCGIRGEEPRGPKGLKCEGSSRGALGTPRVVGLSARGGNPPGEEPGE